MIQRPSKSTLKSIFCPKDLSNVRAISHGKGKEKVTRTLYARKMHQQVQGFAIFDAGISVHPKFPNFLILVQPQMGKCLIHHQTANLDCWKLSVLIQNEGIHLIKRHHTQTFILKKLELIFTLRKLIYILLKYKGSWPSLGYHAWCDFCVYLSDTNEMCVDRIYFDSDNWENKLLPKLKNFFFNYALLFIAGQAKRVESCSRTNAQLVVVGSHS